MDSLFCKQCATPAVLDIYSSLNLQSPPMFGWQT